jgi:hypothetical protein
VNADGTFLSQFGFASLAHPVAGQYDLQLTNPPAVANNTIPVATILAGSAGGQITFILLIGGFEILTYNAAGVQTDRIFSIVVFDLT